MPVQAEFDGVTQSASKGPEARRVAAAEVSLRPTFPTLLFFQMQFPPKETLHFRGRQLNGKHDTVFKFFGREFRVARVGLKFGLIDLQRALRRKKDFDFMIWKTEIVLPLPAGNVPPVRARAFVSPITGQNRPVVLMLVLDVDRQEKNGMQFHPCTGGFVGMFVIKTYQT